LPTVKPAAKKFAKEFALRVSIQKLLSVFEIFTDIIISLQFTNIVLKTARI
jgi:hypothetical protein